MEYTEKEDNLNDSQSIHSSAELFSSDNHSDTRSNLSNSVHSSMDLFDSQLDRDVSVNLFETLENQSEYLHAFCSSQDLFDSPTSNQGPLTATNHTSEVASADSMDSSVEIL